VTVAVLNLLVSKRDPMSDAAILASLIEFGFDQLTLMRCFHETASTGLVFRNNLGKQQK
jgi:hypothetical protein